MGVNSLIKYIPNRGTNPSDKASTAAFGNCFNDIAILLIAAANNIATANNASTKSGANASTSSSTVGLSVNTRTPLVCNNSQTCGTTGTQIRMNVTSAISHVHRNFANFPRFEISR